MNEQTNKKNTEDRDLQKKDAPISQIPVKRGKTPSQRTACKKKTPQSRKKPSENDRTAVLPDTSKIKKAEKDGAATRVSDPIHLQKEETSKKEEEKKTPKRIVRRYRANSGVASFVGTVVYLAIVLVVSVLLSLFAIEVANEAFAFKKGGVPVDVTLTGDFINVDSLAEQLHEQHVIKFPTIFKIYAGLRHKDDKEFVAGKYKDVSPQMGYDALLALFLPPEQGRKEITISVPEGYTVDNIIDLMVQNGIGTREAFVEVINTYDFDTDNFWFLEGVPLITDPENDPRIYRLEGFLHPDTYRFYDSYADAEGETPGTAGAKAVVTKMLTEFKNNVRKSYLTKHREYMAKVYPDAPELSFYELMILASVLEKESLAEERVFISAVFYNRLSNPDYEGIGGRLESNATVLYAIAHDTGVYPKEFTDFERNYDSPYNSYHSAGLPPTPVCTPTADSLNAALYPQADSVYYYFVASDSGYSFFAATLAEHEENVRRAKDGELADPPFPDDSEEDDYA